MQTLAPVPMRNPLLIVGTWLMDAFWVRWLTALLNRANIAPALLGRVSASDQSASISTTAIGTSYALDAGQYRVSYTLNVVRAATTSSSATFTAGWTYNGVSLSQSGAAMTGNTTTTQQNGAFTLNVDAATTVTYAVAYASVGATTMQYDLSVNLEALP